MKTQILILLLLTAPYFNFAQITIEAEDLPTAEDDYVSYSNSEELPLADIGADQVWDFSFLIATDSFAQILELPDSCFNAAMYPDADFCQFDGLNGFINFYSTDNGQLNYLGFSIENWNNTGPLDVIYDPVQLELPTPLTFEDTYSDSAAFVVVLPDDLGNPWIRVSQTITSNVLVDGWGTLLLPGDSISVLRQTNTTIIHEIDEEYVDGVWELLDEFSFENTTTTFVAKEGYPPILTQTHHPYDQNSSIQTFWNQSYDFTNQLAPVAEFDFLFDFGNGFTNVFFQDASSNWPTEFLWTQDGVEISNNNNPVISVTQETTAEFCLTASNNAGSDQICKTIEIPVPTPVMASFTATEVQPMSGFYNFTNESTGDIIFYSWTVDGDQFSTSSDPSYLFSTDGFYEICLYVEDDNFQSDEFCQTLFVQIGMPPMANFTFSQLDKPGEYSFVDVSSNNPESWSWDFGDGNTSDLQNPTHTYTADGLFTACLTATNNFGSDESCVNIDINVSTSESQFPKSWSVFPNPTNEFVNIHFGTSIPHNGQLTIYNMQGQLLMEKNINSDLLLNARSFSSGVYVLKIIDSEGKSYIKRIIKN